MQFILKRRSSFALCILRNSLKYVSWKDYKAVTADLKQVYQTPTEAQARENLTAKQHIHTLGASSARIFSP